MNCLKCIRAANDCEIDGLFNKLKVPQQERLVLLKMVRNKKLSCSEVKRILLSVCTLIL
jgi:hypothetical protein